MRAPRRSRVACGLSWIRRTTRNRCGRQGSSGLGQLIVVEGTADQSGADVLADVIVAERDRVGIAEGAAADLGGGPHADAAGCCAGLDRPRRGRRCASRRAARAVGRGARTPVQSWRAAGRLRRGATPTRGWQPIARRSGTRACRPAPDRAQASPNRTWSRRHAANASRPTTRCSITAAINASRMRPVRGTRRPGMAAKSIGQDRVIGLESRRVVLGTDQPRQPVEQLCGAWSPRLGPDQRRLELPQDVRDGAARHPAGAPQVVAVVARRRVALALAQHAQCQGGVDGGLESQLTRQRDLRCRDHEPSVPLATDGGSDQASKPRSKSSPAAGATRTGERRRLHRGESAP